MSDAAAAARHNVRPLLPGPADALRAEVDRLGLPPDRLSAIAVHGAVEALAVQGLSAGQASLLERLVREGGGAVLAARDGSRALVLTPLMTAGRLPALLDAAGAEHAGLGSAIGAALMARGAPPPPVRAGDHVLDARGRTLVMGVLNVTPDSFAGDAIHGDTAALAERARAFAEAGADIVDIGGESTRPNSQPVDVEEELARVLPAIAAVRAAVDLPISVDTRKAAVAAAAVAEGAAVVNDVWGLRGDPAMAEVVAANAQVALVAMHNQRGTDYANLMEDVCASLRESLRIAGEHGIAPDRVIVDPGFGFAKTPAQNLELVRRLGELRALGRPILLGPSRKHTIGALLGGLPPGERVEGTLALVALAIAAGVSIVRVHDVGPAVRAARVADAVVRGTPSAIAALPPPGPTG